MILFRRRADPLRSLMKAVLATKRAIMRLATLENIIMSRRESLLNKAVRLEELGNTYLARKYIEEASRLEAIATRVRSLRYVFERISLSLELAMRIRDLDKVAREVISIVSDLKKLPELTIPELNLTIYELETYARDLVGAKLPGPMVAFSDRVGDEALKILEEARAIAREKLLNEVKVPDKVDENSG